MTNEIRWIDRNAEGKICGHYARKQREGQEFLPEDHEELLAFNAKSKAAMEAAQQAAAQKDALIVEMSTKLAAMEKDITDLKAAAKP